MREDEADRLVEGLFDRIKDYTEFTRKCIQELEGVNERKKTETYCLSCRNVQLIQFRVTRCQKCGGELAPRWYGRSIPLTIWSKVAGGRRIVPIFYVEVRANLHPVPVNDGDPFLSWLAAEKWFVDQGYQIVENEKYGE